MERIEVYPNVSSDFTIDFLVEGVRIQLRFIYNVESELWMINSYKELDNDIEWNGIVVKEQYPLTYGLSVSIRGTLMVGKTDKEVADTIEYNTFGNGWDLFYLTPAEFEAWEDAHGLQ